MIRRATSAEHPWISGLAAKVYQDLGDYGIIIPSWLEEPGVLAYLEESDGPAAAWRGFILLGFYEPNRGPLGTRIADLLAIAVEPAHQRRGVGRRLLTHAIDTAAGVGRSQGVEEIRLTVAHTNQVGQRLFASAGFEILDDNHGSYDGGQRAIRMARRLVLEGVA